MLQLLLCDSFVWTEILKKGLHWAFSESKIYLASVPVHTLLFLYLQLCVCVWQQGDKCGNSTEEK